MTRLASLVLALAACGGHSSSTLGNQGGAALAIKSGSYPCAFIADGTTYGPFRCVIAGTHIDKKDGMEPWSGTLAPTPLGVRLDARRACVGGGDCSATASFSVDFAAEPGSTTFRGKVAGSPDWWLSGATLEIQKGGMGGDQYGGAAK